MILDCLWSHILPLLFTQLAQYTLEPKAPEQPNEIPAPHPHENASSLDGLFPEIQLDQYRYADNRVSINRYGPTPPGNHQNGSWNLLSQDSTHLPDFLEAAEWDCAAFLEKDRAFFVGTVPDPMWSLQLGFIGTDFRGGSQTPDDLRGVISRDIQSGRFSASRELVVLVEERKRADSSVFRVRAYDEGDYRPPLLLNDVWTTPPSIISFPYKSIGDGAPETHVSLGYDSGNRSLIWTCTSWTAGFAEFVSYKIIESETPAAPPNFTMLDGDTIIRAFYGPSPNSTTFKLETLQLPSSESAHPSEIQILSSQTFPITWNTSGRYISYAAFPSTDDRSASMVILLEDPETAALSTIVFPQSRTTGFLPPTAKPVKIPDGFPSVTAPFSKTLRVQQTPYISHGTGARVEGGLLQFFDNGGMLGARLLAPALEDGGLSYEVVGQDPTLAGQASNVIGWRFREV